jgi:hypothetical protein
VRNRREYAAALRALACGRADVSALRRRLEEERWGGGLFSTARKVAEVERAVRMVAEGGGGWHFVVARDGSRREGGGVAATLNEYLFLREGE